MFWHTGTNIPVQDGPSPRADTVHVHKATSQLPVGQGAQTFANGSMAILAYDIEARGMGSATAEELTEPTEIVGNQVAYTFTPDGSPRTYGIEMAEMVKDMPWKSGTSKSPGFQSALARVVDWGQP